MNGKMSLGSSVGWEGTQHSCFSAQRGKAPLSSPAMLHALPNWLLSHRKAVASASLPLIAAAFAAAALSWRLGRPKKPIRFSPDGLTRPLSELDAWYSSKNLAHNLPNFYIVACLTGKPWTLNEAQVLLSRVMSRHPASMCTLVDQDDPTSEPYWQRLWHPSYAANDQGIMDLYFETRATGDEQDETWKTLAVKHESEGFSVSRPRHTLFRFIIVSKPDCSYFEVIFVPHHGVCDARGASYFVRQMLEEWALIQAEGNDKTVTPIDLRYVSIDGIPVTNISAGDGQGAQNGSAVTVPQSTWPAELETRVRTTPGLMYLLKVWLQDKLSLFRPVSQSWIGPVDRGTTLRPTAEIQYLKVPSSRVEALKTACRAHGVTVNGALWAAVIFALFRTYRETVKAGKEPQTGSSYPSIDKVHLTLEVPIDMRTRLGISNSVLSPMVTGAAIDVSANGSTQFWETSKFMNDRITEEILTNAVWKNGMSRWVPKPTVPWLFARESRPPNGRTDTLKMSNLAVVPFQDGYGDIKVRDVWFGRHGMREALLFSMTVITSGANRDMNIIINGTKELLASPNDVVLLKDTISQVIEHAAGTGAESSFCWNDLFSDKANH